MIVDTAKQSSRILRIASAQYPFDEVASLDAWKDKLARWVASGAATGADVLVFPEYASFELVATFGRDIASDLQQSLVKVAEHAGERTQAHSELATKHNVIIVSGSGPVMTEPGRFVNAAQVITPDGLVGEQHKLMMTPFERSWGMSPGTELKVFKTPLATFALTICYDVEFPLIARAAAEHGAECLLVPSCTERVSGYHRVRTGALARALENTVVAVQSSTIGPAEWSPAIDYNSGAAGIYLPAEHAISESGVVRQGTLNEPGWVYGEVDLSRLRQVREGGEMRNFQDWTLQPGGSNTAIGVEVVDLTSKDAQSPALSDALGRD